MQKSRLKIVLSLFLVVALSVSCAAVLVPMFSSESNPVYAEGNAWDYGGTYYDNLNDQLTGSAFRAELAKLITETHNTNANSYDKLKSQFNVTDADPSTGTGMLWFYTGTKVGKYGGTTNREHVWPKAGGDAFPEKTGPGCDLQHLRPTDSTLNSTRGSLSFDELPYTSKVVTENGSTNYGDPANGKDRLCYTDGSFFYPAKGYRGATARILMYVQTRWGNEHKLTFVDTAGNCKTIGKISTLFKWHLEEPPTASEIYRNQKAYEIQGNRNPFIDHPEYAAQIYCFDGKSYNAALQNVLQEVGDPYNNSAPLVSLAFQEENLSVAVGQTATLHVVKNPTNAKANLVWTSSDNNVATVSDGVVTAVATGTATITATDRDTNLSATATVSVKHITDLSVSGSPAKTTYHAGQSFDPTGLTVTATYNDGSTGQIGLSDCQWLDGSTRNSALAAGTTTVICKYGSFEITVNEITVQEAQGGSFEISTSSFSLSGSYAYHTWNVDGVSGTAFIYGGQQSKMQFNNSKAHYYLASTSPTPGGITEITVVMSEGSKQWTLLTSQTPYQEEATAKVPTQGTDCGTKTATTEGVTWELDGTDTFFSLNYADSGAAYIAKIIVTYGGGSVVANPVSLNKTTTSLVVGGQETLVATGGTGAITWNSSDQSVATVVNGTVTAVSAGTAIITVSDAAGGSASCTVTVTNADEPTPDGVTLNKQTLSLTVGASETLVAAVTGANSAVWSTSDSAIATVDQNGTVTAVSAGTVTITATVGTASASCTVTVTRADSDADVYPVDMSDLKEDVAYKLALNQVQRNQKLFIINQIALSYYVDSTTDLQEAADVFITKTTDGFYVYFQSGATKTYLNAVVSGTHVNLVPQSSSQQNTVWYYDAENHCIATKVNGDVRYIGSFADKTTFSLSELSRITGDNAANVGVSQYIAYFCTTEQEPTPDGVTLDKQTLSLTVGASETLVATVTGANSAVWSTSDGAIATVDQNGNVTAVSAGTVTITATVGTASASCAVTVTNAVEPTPDGVTLNKQTLSLTVGASEALVATVTGTNSAVWSTSDGAIATVGQNGNVTAVSAGTVTITVTVGTASASCVITISISNAQRFEAAVQTVENASGRQDKFVAIKNALAVYDSLSSEEKASVQNAYQTLQNAVISYNQSVQSDNQEHLVALNNVLTYGAFLSAGFVALLAFLKQKLM